jgi:ATP-dependent Clp protease protease subunit
MSEMILDFKTLSTDGIYDELYKQLWNKRILYLNGEIDESVIDYIAAPILIKNIEEQDIPEEKLKPITIWINSYGGNADVGLYMIDLIQESRIPIHCKVLSMAASAALYMCIACKYRVASKNSILLLHKGSYSIGGNANEVEDVLDFYKGEVDKKIVELILNRTNLTEDKLKKIRRNETYCLGEKALEYGFVDEIV